MHNHLSNTGQDLPPIGGGWLLAKPRPTPARVPTADECAAIRQAATLPGGIDRSICGGCGERAWTMVPLSGLCLDCYREWFDGKGVAA